MFQSFFTVIQVWWMNACGVILQWAHHVPFAHIVKMFQEFLIRMQVWMNACSVILQLECHEMEACWTPSCFHSWHTCQWGWSTQKTSECICQHCCIWRTGMATRRLLKFGVDTYLPVAFIKIVHSLLPLPTFHKAKYHHIPSDHILRWQACWTLSEHPPCRLVEQSASIHPTEDAWRVDFQTFFNMHAQRMEVVCKEAT
jgi:hypothetical protein